MVDAQKGKKNLFIQVIILSIKLPKYWCKKKHLELSDQEKFLFLLLKTQGYPEYKISFSLRGYPCLKLDALEKYEARKRSKEYWKKLPPDVKRERRIKGEKNFYLRRLLCDTTPQTRRVVSRMFNIDYEYPPKFLRFRYILTGYYNDEFIIEEYQEEKDVRDKLNSLVSPSLYKYYEDGSIEEITLV